MSARDEVLHNLRGYTPREDTGDDPAAQMLAAYRAEVLREAEASIRADLAKLPEAEAFSYGAAYQQGMDWAARVVDQMTTP